MEFCICPKSLYINWHGSADCKSPWAKRRDPLQLSSAQVQIRPLHLLDLGKGRQCYSIPDAPEFQRSVLDCKDSKVSLSCLICLDTSPNQGEPHTSNTMAFESQHLKHRNTLKSMKKVQGLLLRYSWQGRWYPDTDSCSLLRCQLRYHLLRGPPELVSLQLTFKVVHVPNMNVLSKK